MAEIVTKEQYWIDILNDNSKFGQITTEDTSFNLRANDVWKVIENSLLVTEDEEDVANWEGITQLSGEGLTIFQRKVNILYTLSAKNYVPISIIGKIVEKTAGVEVNIEWDKENDKVIVHTDRADVNTVEDTNSIINCVLPNFLELDRYNHNLDISWDEINKYTACTNTEEMYSVNPDYKKDLTNDKEWVYPLPEMLQFGQRYPNGTYGGLSWSETVKCDINLPKGTMLDSAFRCMSQLKYFKLNAPVATNLSCVVAESGALEHLEIYAPNGDASVYGITYGTKLPKLKKAIIYLPKTQYFGTLNAANLQDADIDLSSVCRQCTFQTQLNKESSIKLLNTIPSVNPTSETIFTIGIHIDNQSDEEVLAAISDATAKGWTVTTQWNGTATTSTYSLRPTQSQPIYAKCVSEELGMYIDANDVRYFVNWGHMISSPDGKSPDELGYQEFASLEEALTTWGLTEIMEISEQES